MYLYRTVTKANIKKSRYDFDAEIVELGIPETQIHMFIRSFPKQPLSDVSS